MPTSSADSFPPGSVVVVPFPYSDRLAERRRPALVVSGPDVERSGLLWITMITSARNPAMLGDLPIADLAPTGLAVASTIRPLKLACIDPSRVLRRIGALGAIEADGVYTRLRGLIGPP